MIVVNGGKKNGDTAFAYLIGSTYLVSVVMISISAIILSNYANFLVDLFLFHAMVLFMFLSSASGMTMVGAIFYPINRFSEIEYVLFAEFAFFFVITIPIYGAMSTNIIYLNEHGEAVFHLLIINANVISQWMIVVGTVIFYPFKIHPQRLLNSFPWISFIGLSLSVSMCYYFKDDPLEIFMYRRIRLNTIFNALLFTLTFAVRWFYWMRHIESPEIPEVTLRTRPTILRFIVPFVPCGDSSNDRTWIDTVTGMVN